jgi:hypothetical protein
VAELEHDLTSASDTDTDLVEQLRTSIRQRRAEIATGSATSISPELLELEATQYLKEPVPISPRAVIGPLLIRLRRLFRDIILKWYSLPLLQKQNRFNSAAAVLIRQLIEENQMLRGELADLRDQVDSLRSGSDS